MQTTPIAKTYVDGLADETFNALCSLENSNPDFLQFLAGPCEDPVTTAKLAIQLNGFGIPEEYTNSAYALHYFVVAVNNRASGNG